MKIEKILGIIVQKAFIKRKKDKLIRKNGKEKLNGRKRNSKMYDM